MGRKRWSEEIKAQAMADLAAGMKVDDVAEKYDMPRSTAAHLAPGSKRGKVKISKIANLQDLEAAFRRQLALNFAAQEAIMQQVCNAEWLSQQSASDLVGLFSALFGKGGKLLGALYGPGATAALDPDTDGTDTEDAAP